MGMCYCHCLCLGRFHCGYWHSSTIIIMCLSQVMAICIHLEQRKWSSEKNHEVSTRHVSRCIWVFMQLFFSSPLSLTLYNEPYTIYIQFQLRPWSSLCRLQPRLRLLCRWSWFWISCIQLWPVNRTSSNRCDLPSLLYDCLFTLSIREYNALRFY